MDQRATEPAAAVVGHPIAEDGNAAFVVIDMKTGHKWKIWENGRIEGFPGDCVVVNRIPRVGRIIRVENEVGTT